MQEHVELEVSLEIIMAKIAQEMFLLKKENDMQQITMLNNDIQLQEEAYKGNRKAIESILK